LETAAQPFPNVGRTQRKGVEVRSRLGRSLPIVLVVTALIVAVFGWQTPAMAHGAQHAIFAHNADKVDGRHGNQLVRATTQT
jgi:hypothetical protein